MGGGSATEATASWPMSVGRLASVPLLITVAAVKTLLTKFIFEDLPTPVAYSLLSACITAVLLLPPLVCGLRGQKRCVQCKDLAMLALVSTAVAVDLGMSNTAIALLPLQLQQAMAAAIPAATILLETMVTRRLKQPIQYVAILLLCFGAALGHMGSLADQTGDTLYGELSMLLAIFAAAAKYVFCKAALAEWKEQLGAVGLLFWIELCIAAILLPWAALNGELRAFAQLLSARPPSGWLGLCAAAALGGFRFFCELIVLRFWSATTLSATNLAAHSFIMILAIPLFGSTVTPLLIAGAAVTFGASAFYAYLKVRTAEDAPAATSPASKYLSPPAEKYAVVHASEERSCEGCPSPGAARSRPGGRVTALSTDFSGRVPPRDEGQSSCNLF